MIAALLDTPAGAGLRLVSFAGLGIMALIAWLLSTDRKAVRYRPVLWGIGLQLVLGLLVLNPALQTLFFGVVDQAMRRLLEFSQQGANFVFQSLEPHRIAGPTGDPVTVVGRISPPLKTFAFWILPTIIFFSSLMAILYHLRVMQRVVWALAWVMQRTLGTSGPESLTAAANIFVGQTEAPLLVRPYVATMTVSELNAMMTAGFATVAGGVMAAYVGFLQAIPGIAGHLVTASILSAPASLAVAKLMVPETEPRQARDELVLCTESPHRNLIEAAASGAIDGVKLAINVAAMLIAFVGLIAMVDFSIGWIELFGAPLSLSRIFGWLFAPVALAMGIPWHEAAVVGRLLGEKIILTEFIAYVHLGDLIASTEQAISQRTAVIASYALCGFANFASIGVQLGGIGGISPERLGDLSALALRAMIGGSLAAFMTGCVAGILL
ncbi:MAG TPA: nucleoside transporter C-terminal domain-containing protein [Polyangiaceae bacterium]|nr:nucleoside transporter C-terminal domain-containing protein [Polyangiaceae bacterium]